MTPGITAAEWVEHATVDQAIHERWNDYAVVLVAVDRLDPVIIEVAADRLVGQAIASVQNSDDIDDHIAAWHATYRDFAELRQIRGLRLTINHVRAKFKYDGAEPGVIRRQVANGYQRRNSPGDTEALNHLLRRHPPPP